MYNTQKPTKWGHHIYESADSTNEYDCCLIPCYGLRTIESVMPPEVIFTSRIIPELISKVQNATTHVKGYNLYTASFILTWTYQAGQKHCFIVTHVQGSQDSIPTSVLPHIIQ
jgi:hypothetical protein